MIRFCILYSATDLKVVIVVVYLFVCLLVCLFACFRSLPTSIHCQSWCTLTFQSKSVRWEWLMAQLSLTIWECTSPLLTHTHPAMSWQSSELTPMPLSFSISWWIREIVWFLRPKRLCNSCSCSQKDWSDRTHCSHMYTTDTRGYWMRACTHTLWVECQTLLNID